MIKFERDKHVELARVEAEALTHPKLLRALADITEALEDAYAAPEFGGLVFFRDRTEAELAEAEAHQKMLAEYAARSKATSS